MSELSQTLSKGFEGMAHEDPVVAGQALRDYKEEVIGLDSTIDGGLDAEHLEAELVSEGSEIHSRIGSTVEALLGAITYKPLGGGEEIVMFQDGSSMVVIDSKGKLVSYFHKPLDDETLKSYGSHLKWGLTNAAHTRLAHIETGHDIDTEEGYAAATRAAKNLPQDKTHRDHDYATLPHLGSAFIHDESGNPLIASTSGMLLEQEVINDLLNGPEDNPLVMIAKAAKADEEAVTGGFDGNILIGALESMFSKSVLEVALGQKTIEQALEEWDISKLIEEDAAGINVH